MVTLIIHPIGGSPVLDLDQPGSSSDVSQGFEQGVVEPGSPAHVQNERVLQLAQQVLQNQPPARNGINRCRCTWENEKWLLGSIVSGAILGLLIWYAVKIS